MTKSILVFSVVILLLVPVILYVIGRKSVHSEITIQATPKEVWSTLTDFSGIKEWNSVLVPIEGVLKEGTTIRYEFRQDQNSSSIIPASVKKIVENRLLNQTGGMTGLLTFDHRYILEPSESGTKVIIHEEYRGIMVPFWNPAQVGDAYNRLAQALKARVEGIKRKSMK